MPLFYTQCREVNAPIQGHSYQEAELEQKPSMPVKAEAQCSWSLVAQRPEQGLENRGSKIKLNLGLLSLGLIIILPCHSACCDLWGFAECGKSVNEMLIKITPRGTWVAQSVKHPTSAQVMISRFVGSSPVSGSVLTTQPGACFGFCVSLSLPLPHSCSVSLCLRNKYTLKKFKKRNRIAGSYGNSI